MRLSAGGSGVLLKLDPHPAEIFFAIPSRMGALE
jgi:hypothetical protein